MPTKTIHKISPAKHKELEKIYGYYNHAKFINPDPLVAVRGFKKKADIEIAGLIASSLAFGNVKTILASIENVLNEFPEPYNDLMRFNKSQIKIKLKHFRHRYVGGEEMSDFLIETKALINTHGSIHKAFLNNISENDTTIIPALEKVCNELRKNSTLKKNYLITNPRNASACKRHFMYLRWMIRKDKVDLGIWKNISPALLIYPMDTHMSRVAHDMQLCDTKLVNLKAAIQVTESFKRISPEDPVKYDFALTRAGIRREKITIR